MAAFLLCLGLLTASAFPAASQRREARKLDRMCAPELQTDPKAQGSYFRKVESRAPEGVKDMVVFGITGTVALPQFITDFHKDRYFLPLDPDKADLAGPLDRASVYLGAQTGKDAWKKVFDAGLIWDRVFRLYRLKVHATFTDQPNGCDGGQKGHQFIVAEDEGKWFLVDGADKKVKALATQQTTLEELEKLGLRPDYAFRPFWRTTNGYRNQMRKPVEGSPENVYFYPGQKVRMTLLQRPNLDKNTLELKPTNFFHIDIDALKDPQDGAGPSFGKSFVQEGFLRKDRILKRVNAIDQFYVNRMGERKSNENKPVIPTNAKALGAAWEYATMLGPRGLDDPLFPLSGGFCAETVGKDTDGAWYQILYHPRDFDEGGAEALDIIGKEPRRRSEP
ncbi:MAG: hypothetical protein HY921_11875 [Elusimicrobia bacterium]|nr:hypothetical protein [Elusimicrobiota bacterium]